MNNCDLGGLWWSVSLQHNTYGLHYKLHVAAVKCTTTGHKCEQTACSNCACNTDCEGLRGIKTDIYTHRTHVALLNELALKICSVEIQSR